MGFWTALMIGLFVGAMIGATGMGIIAGGKKQRPDNTDTQIEESGF
jgi:hypothetical protein